MANAVWRTVISCSMPAMIVSVALPDSSTIRRWNSPVVSASRPDCQPAGTSLGQHRVQFVECRRGAGLGEQARGHRLDARPRDHDVGDRRARQLEQQPGGAGHDLGARHPHPGSGARSAAHLDQPLGLEHPDRLAQRRTADAEVRHQLGLVGQEVAVLELAVDHHAA